MSQTLPARMKARLLKKPPAMPAAPHLKQAAVLMPILIRKGEPSMLFIRRADHLRSHPGQIAFPGGAREKEDATLAQTALREAEEEVGLPSNYVSISGFLNLHETPSGYLILPVIGLVYQDFLPQAEKSEVAEIFEAPLAFLMNPNNHQRSQREWKGKRHIVYGIPYRRRRIWGVTAGILRSLYERVFREEGEESASGRAIRRG